MHLLTQRASFARVPLRLAPALVSARARAGFDNGWLGTRSSHSATKKPRGRETVKFPFVWPAEAHRIPDHSSVSAFKPNTLIKKIGIWFTQSSSKLMFDQLFDEEYRQTMQEKMAGMAFQTVVEAINSKEYSRLDDVCSPQVARMYKYALSHLDAQKCRIKISSESAGTPWIGGYMFKIGPPEAFDTAIPFGTRSERFECRIDVNTRIAWPRASRAQIRKTPIMDIVKGTNDSTLAVDVWCKVPVSLKIELWKNGRLLDSDEGKMTVPLTFSSPFYDNLLDMSAAISQTDRAEELEPFRWSISDIFFAIDTQDIIQIYQAQQKSKQMQSGGTQE